MRFLSPMNWEAPNTSASTQLKMVGFHWMNIWLRNTRVAPPKIMTASSSHSRRFSKLRLMA